MTSLKSFPKLNFFEDISLQEKIKEMELDFINAFKEIKEIKEIESGKKVAKTWQEIRNDL